MTSDRLMVQILERAYRLDLRGDHLTANVLRDIAVKIERGENYLDDSNYKNLQSQSTASN